MSIGTLRAFITLSLCLAFLALWVWAWRKARHADFQSAALLALDGDEQAANRSERT